jgi:iron-sulfur cluster repair protein YtfE (RIC family)
MLSTKEQLSEDHEHHERLLLAVGRALATEESPEEVRRRWLPFERNLLEHLDTEENVLFPLFDAAQRDEVIALRAKHREIRYALIEISVSVELHTVKARALQSLLVMLREHARHEESSLHEWIEQEQSVLALRGVLALVSRCERSADLFGAPQ